MINWILNHKKEMLQILLVILIFTSIRYFEENIFYDPFINYFKNDLQVYPKYDSVVLHLNIFLRYSFNSILSILVLKIIFKNKIQCQNLIIIFIIIFIAFILIHFILLNLSEKYKIILFYARRVLIQPIILILLIPTFYHNFYINSQKK